MRIITLTTDFGLEDAYVAAMKGVILSLAPKATLVDVSHQVPPQDVFRAALLLESFLPYYPADAIHLLVVDPGVGTERRPLAARTPQGFFVAPDNGVLTPALAHGGESILVHLTETRYFRPSVSEGTACYAPTFHGRDIFAPVAAHLARGVPVEALGQVVSDPVLLNMPQATRASPGVWLAEVIHVDRFGNLITSLRKEDLEGHPQEWAFEIGGRHLSGLHRTYSEVAVGQLLALTGSTGRIEIAQREGHAARALGLGTGARVIARHFPGHLPGEPLH